MLALSQAALILNAENAAANILQKGDEAETQPKGLWEQQLAPLTNMIGVCVRACVFKGLLSSSVVKI